ncbi:hypothetical protein AMAG_18213 [Allomyces macrogynus ATCC 38327]|uniref:WLM domain-containing protein n=1 Tax=Allomyces macrogynus (strain ATCC 38327) TaxID=578462 RepID=A0A0L0SAS6_ALLM3|nr:hypothetical protein AMAG_18213 [Allomyces macrogynus ATCC 38327]|eukprot:KNE59596.1 hypothetical protein AMAG_18213 [Allomyces macrogynus ATCC 38327]
MSRIKERYRSSVISEGVIEEGMTSYTVNKGEKIVFCLRSRDTSSVLYDDNLLFSVAMHELAHVASVSESHSPEFQDNFGLLVGKAVERGSFVHRDQDVDYCGLHLTRI